MNYVFRLNCAESALNIRVLVEVLVLVFTIIFALNFQHYLVLSALFTYLKHYPVRCIIEYERPRVKDHLNGLQIFSILSSLYSFSVCHLNVFWLEKLLSQSKN